jgi:predicted DNA-binding WGR domain protein
MQHITDTTPLPHHIHLQAVDYARNIARDYQIETTPDLFGHIIVALYWGRIGTRGQSRVMSFVAEGPARRFVSASGEPPRKGSVLLTAVFRSR